MHRIENCCRLSSHTHTHTADSTHVCGGVKDEKRMKRRRENEFSSTENETTNGFYLFYTEHFYEIRLVYCLSSHPLVQLLVFSFLSILFEDAATPK